MTTITWVRGDKPLPLQVNMDLTGCTVQVVIRDYDDETATPTTLTGTVTAATTGGLTVDVSSYADGRWAILVRVLQGGVLVATFPNSLVKTLLLIGEGF